MIEKLVHRIIVVELDRVNDLENPGVGERDLLFPDIVDDPARVRFGLLQTIETCLQASPWEELDIDSTIWTHYDNDLTEETTLGDALVNIVGRIFGQSVAASLPDEWTRPPTALRIPTEESSEDTASVARPAWMTMRGTDTLPLAEHNAEKS